MFASKSLRCLLGLLVLVGCDGNGTEDAGNGGGGGGGGSSSSACLGAHDSSPACLDELNRACSKRDVSTCSSASGCAVVSGQETDDAGTCTIGESQELGCANLGCGQAWTLVSDPDGKKWLLPNTCKPLGWVEEAFTMLSACSSGGAGGAN